MERQKFEESWQDAFKQAEMSPSNDVWTNIELDLEKANGGKLKRRLLFFKLLAAASIVFAMGIGGSVIYVLNQQSEDQSGKIASNTDSSTQITERNKKESQDEGIADSESKTSQNIAGAAQVTRDNNDNSSTPSVKANENSTRISSSDTFNKGNAFVLSESDQNSTSSIRNSDAISDLTDGVQPEGSELMTGKLPSLVRLRKPVLHFPKTEPDQIDLLLASIEMAEKDQNKKDKRSEQLWTSVGFSAGAFNAINANSSAPETFSNQLAASNVLANESKASGVSYSVGVTVGGKVSDRWVLQGGVNYLTQNSEFTSSAVITSNLTDFKAASSVELNKISDQPSSREKIVPTAPYSVNNNLRYMSIPLQAGYLLVNRNFGLQINGGVSTDLFMQSTLTPEGENVDKVSQDAGEDSPYRTVNFSGLFGTELSYKFSSHYRISLNPGVRYPLNSIYKSDVDLESSPLTFDIGLRFRYIFH